MDPGAGRILDEEAQRARIEEEYRRLMHERRLRAARVHLRGGELGLAERAARDALHFDPASREAQALLRRIQSALGNRAATADDLLETALEAERVRREELVVVLRAHLERARKAAAAGDYERAGRDYERVLNILTTTPHLGGEREGMEAAARAGLKRLAEEKRRE
ncbi:MAG: hypothetical protein ACE5JG_03570 [Planctomycetota bacterium]